MILGYARVSTRDQNLDGQWDALAAAGAERIFADTITGTARIRPELDRLLSELRSGDVIVVTKYDRLARSLKDLLEIVDLIQAKGAGFRSLGEDIDTTTPAGRLVFHVFASIAQFERERIVERTKEGLVLWIWQASEVLEATARHAIYGVQWRRLDRKWLGLLKDRSRV
jgi:DNA invertase Pin-like site-specific DNA recombinase